MNTNSMTIVMFKKIHLLMVHKMCLMFLLFSDMCVISSLCVHLLFVQFIVEMFTNTVISPNLLLLLHRSGLFLNQMYLHFSELLHNTAPHIITEKLTK